MAPSDVTPKRKKAKSWPAFALWIQRLLQANEDEAKAQPPSIPSGLYVTATPIGNLGDITVRALYVLQHVDAVLCEDTRVTGALLHQYGIKKPLISVHDHNEASRIDEVLLRLEQGGALALVSDAGTPLISDPGYRLVRACRDMGHHVEALPGASAILTALASAGLPTDRFLFVGFLSSKQMARRKELENLAATNATLIFYESPQRVAETLKEMTAVFGVEREAAVGRELTKLYEDMRTGSLGGLAADYEAAEVIKGEIVILVAPAPKGVGVSEADLDAALRQALKTMSVRDASALWAEKLNLNKREVYQRALALEKATRTREPI